MKDVALIEAEGNGFWLIDLFGERRFVAEKIQSLDLTRWTVSFDTSTGAG